MPANGGSVTRNDIRAIARAELDHDEVVIVMGAPIQTTPPETRMSGAQLLKQLAALPGEPSKRSVVMSAGLQKVDEHYAVDLHNPLRNTGTVTAPEGQLFLLSAELSGETPQEWLQRWKEKH
jgi:hypothetical protein